MSRYPQGVAFVAALHGDTVAQVERINYNKALEQLVVDAQEGDDTVTLDDNWAATTVRGGLGADHFQVGQIFKSQRDAVHANIAPNDEFETTLTTRGHLSNGISFATTIEGNDGNDEFTVFRNIAPLYLLGGAGDDLFAVRAFALEGSQTTTLSGGGGADSVQYAMNAPLILDGGDGSDTLRVVGTEFSEKFVITETAIYGAGRTVTYVGLEKLEIDGAEGNDEFYVLSTNASVETRLYGGLGSDRFSIAGDAPQVIGDSGPRPAEPGTHTANVVHGPLFIDGGPSSSSAAGIGQPVMLPAETNTTPSTGNVVAYSGTGDPGAIDTMIVETADLLAIESTLANLVGKALEISQGPGAGRFWLITAVAQGTTTTLLTLRNASVQPE